MWDDGTLRRLEAALQENISWWDGETIADEDLQRILTSTFLGARPFDVEPNDVILVRVPETMLQTPDGACMVRDHVREVWPDQKVVVLPGDMDLMTVRELLDQDDDEEVRDVAI